MIEHRNRNMAERLESAMVENRTVWLRRVRSANFAWACLLPSAAPLAQERDVALVRRAVPERLLAQVRRVGLALHVLWAPRVLVFQHAPSEQRVLVFRCALLAPRALLFQHAPLVPRVLVFQHAPLAQRVLAFQHAPLAPRGLLLQRALLEQRVLLLRHVPLVRRVPLLQRAP